MADALPREVERHAPVDADRVAAGLAHAAQQFPGADPEVDRRDRQIVEDPTDPRQHRSPVVVGGERPDPRVEQLHGLRAGLGLREQVRARDLRERVHEGGPGLGFAVHQGLRLGVVARGTALDEVARERERRAGEPDERDVELLAEEPDRLEGVRLVRLGLERPETAEALRVPDRLGHDGPDARFDAHVDPDRRERRNDVAEHDRRIEGHAAERLQGDLDGQLGLADRLEDVSLPPGLAVLGEVPAGLAHEPDRGPVDRLAPERSEETVVHAPKDTDRTRGDGPGSVPNDTTPPGVFTYNMPQMARGTTTRAPAPVRDRRDPRVNPLWAKAPFLLLRYPGLFASIAVGAALLALAAAAYPLFISASASELLADNVRDPIVTRWGAGFAYRNRTLSLPGSEPFPHAIERTDRRFRELIGSNPYLADPVVAYLSLPMEGSAPDEPSDVRMVRLFAGDGVNSHIEILEGAPGSGALIPDLPAEALGIGPGDEITLTSRTGAPRRSTSTASTAPSTRAGSPGSGGPGTTSWSSTVPTAHLPRSRSSSAGTGSCEIAEELRMPIDSRSPGRRRSRPTSPWTRPWTRRHGPPASSNR